MQSTETDPPNGTRFLYGIPFYRVIHGNGYCRPSLEMAKYGQPSLACGPDGPNAREMAKGWYEQWLELKRRVDDPAQQTYGAGYICFFRTDAAVYIKFMTEVRDSMALPRVASGEVFSSVVLVRGSKSDEVYLHQKLSDFLNGYAFSPAPMVLEEMRLAATNERVVGAKAESPSAAIQKRYPERLAGRKGGYTSDVTDDQWRMILPILNDRVPGERRTRSPSRDVINAILHHIHSEEPWTRLPSDLPPSDVARLSHRLLTAKHKWERIERVLSDES